MAGGDKHSKIIKHEIGLYYCENCDPWECKKIEGGCNCKCYRTNEEDQSSGCCCASGIEVVDPISGKKVR
tara:strand:- start:4035 stop:4244 length:210 start_codon:yes stop_codon:yes gene_type:complete